VTKQENLQAFIDMLYKEGEIIDIRLIKDRKSGAIDKFVTVDSNVVSKILGIAYEYNTIYNVYFGINPREGRSTNLVSRIGLACVDCDNNPDRFSSYEEYEKHFAKTMNQMSKLNLSPSIIVNSGHGKHLYRVLNDHFDIKLVKGKRKNKKTGEIETVDKHTCEKWRDLQSGLIDLFRSDPVIKDLPRIFRVPGTNNVKDKNDVVACSLESINGQIFNYSDFLPIISQWEEKQNIKEKKKTKTKKINSTCTQSSEYTNLFGDTGEKLDQIEYNNDINKIILEVLSVSDDVCSKYEDFRNLALAFKFAGYSYEEVDQIFSRSSNYDREENKYMYDQLQPTGEHNMKTAYWHANKANPKLLQQLIKKSLSKPSSSVENKIMTDNATTKNLPDPPSDKKPTDPSTDKKNSPHDETPADDKPADNPPSVDITDQKDEKKKTKKKEKKPKNDKKQEIVEKSGKTWVVSREVNPQTNQLESEAWFELCNFQMRLTNKIWDDEHIVKWTAVLRSKHNEEEIELTGSEFLLNHKFKEKISEKGIFLFKNHSFHNMFVEHVFEQSKKTLQTKRQTDLLGRLNSEKEFLFSNGIATPGKVKKLDDMIPPKSVLKIKMPEGDLNQYWFDTLEILNDIYSKETWKIIGFLVASVFYHEIVDAFGFLPITFFNGTKGSGKSKLAEIVLKFFGASREIRPFNFASTQKAWYRQSMRYCGIPLVLNEYHPTKKNNQVLSQLYDREGYIRAKKDNTNATITTDVNSSFLLLSTRCITGFESEALVSRLVTVHFDQIERNASTKKKLNILRSDPALSSFVTQALKIDPKELIRSINREVAKKELKLNADSRIIENHSIIKCCSDAFYQLVDMHEMIGGDINDDIGQQLEDTVEANAAYLFINLIRSELANSRLLNVAKIEQEMYRGEEVEILYFRYSEVAPQIRKVAAAAHEKTDLPDDKTLQRLLHQIGAKTGRKTWNDSKQRRIWMVMLQENFSKDDIDLKAEIEKKVDEIVDKKELLKNTSHPT